MLHKRKDSFDILYNTYEIYNIHNYESHLLFHD
jgi:hypothetical protein